RPAARADAVAMGGAVAAGTLNAPRAALVSAVVWAAATAFTEEPIPPEAARLNPADTSSDALTAPDTELSVGSSGSAPKAVVAVPAVADTSGPSSIGVPAARLSGLCNPFIAERHCSGSAFTRLNACWTLSPACAAMVCSGFFVGPDPGPPVRAGSPGLLAALAFRFAGPTL